jgi:hypothetical protein
LWWLGQRAGCMKCGTRYVWVLLPNRKHWPLCCAGFPQLYGYMLAQRRKVLRGGRSSSAKVKAT